MPEARREALESSERGRRSGCSASEAQAKAGLQEARRALSGAMEATHSAERGVR